MSSSRLVLYVAASILTVLWAGQARAPKFGVSTDITIAPGDQSLLDRVAGWPDFEAHLDPTVITFPVERGGDLLELFRVADATGDRTLSHVSPVVRAYAAYHVMRTRPERAAKLARLLDDDAPLARRDLGDQGDMRVRTHIRDVTLELLCARQDEPEVTRLLRKTAKDLKRIALWAKIRRCFDERGQPAS